MGDLIFLISTGTCTYVHEIHPSSNTDYFKNINLEGGKGKFGSGEMAQQIKVFDAKPDNLNSIPKDMHGERRKLTPFGCPLTSTGTRTMS